MVRQAIVIARRDVRSLYGTAYGYGLTAGFLAAAGVLLVLALRGGQARLDGWFAPLFVLLGILAPLLAMRSFAEEERTGSLELLLTSPVRHPVIVAGKLLANLAMLGLLLLGTIVCPLLVGSMGRPDWGPILTGYAGLVLVGIAFVAVSLATSAATSSQLVATTASAGLLLLLWFGAGVAAGFHGDVKFVATYLSPSTHVLGFLRGSLVVGDVAYFVTLASVAMVATVAILRARR
jgi:ABC-2 type transport system permease protein